MYLKIYGVHIIYGVQKLSDGVHLIYGVQKLSASTEALVTVKQTRFFIGESPKSTEANIELHYVFKINESHGRFTRAITTVADAALDSLNSPETLLYFLLGWASLEVVP